MSYIKAPKVSEQKYYDFLEDLRQSGDTNMFGAPPYLMAAFSMKRERAVSITSDWIKGHSDSSRVIEKPTTKNRTKPGRMVTRYETAEQ